MTDPERDLCRKGCGKELGRSLPEDGAGGADLSLWSCDDTRVLRLPEIFTLYPVCPTIPQMHSTHYCLHQPSRRGQPLPNLRSQSVLRAALEADPERMNC